MNHVRVVACSSTGQMPLGFHMLRLLIMRLMLVGGLIIAMDINFLLQCGTMEGTRILLDHHLNVENLKKKLKDTKLEIKQLEMEEEKETRRMEETIKKLCFLMQNVTEERDEARNHLQMLEQRFMPMNQENHSQQKSICSASL